MILNLVKNVGENVENLIANISNMAKQTFIGYDDEILYSSNDSFDNGRDFESKFKNESKPKPTAGSAHETRTKYFGLKDVLTFGKYKDSTIREVINEDPKWLDWAIKKVEFFNVTEEVRELVADALFNNY